MASIDTPMRQFGATTSVESSLTTPMQLLLFHQDIRKIGL
jgi:hypothetical protein